MRFNELKFQPTECPNGIQAIVGFGDSYELSIVKSDFSYGGKQGLYEIGVFFNGVMKELAGVTNPDDTIKGFLNESEVDGILLKMMALTGEEGSQV